MGKKAGKENSTRRPWPGGNVNHDCEEAHYNLILGSSGLDQALEDSNEMERRWDFFDRAVEVLRFYAQTGDAAQSALKVDGGARARDLLDSITIIDDNTEED